MSHGHSPGRLMLRVVVIAAVSGIGAGLLGVFLAGQFLDSRAPVLEGLQAPRGLTPLDDGSVLIAEVLGGRLLRLAPGGELDLVQEGLPATLGGPGGSYPTGISAAVLVEGTYYYVVGEFRGSRYSALYGLAPAGEPELVAGGTGRDGFPSSRLTNPYDLVLLPQGGLLVSDSGVNAVLHVSQEGVVTDYATFPRRELSTPGEVHSFDVVPTGMTIGPDGALYLASFTGHPYPPGAAYIYRVEDLNHDGDALDQGEVSVFAGGFSAATDLAFAEDGSLLVTEFSTDTMRLITEFGISRAAEVPGRLVRWREGAIEVVAEGLVSPTSVASAGGRVLVSEEFAGRVTEIRSPRTSAGLAWALPIMVGVLAALLVLLPGILAVRRSRPKGDASVPD